MSAWRVPLVFLVASMVSAQVRPPSAHFSLSRWKLTLPVTSDAFFGRGGSDAAEIKPAGCRGNHNASGLDAGFSDQRYFFTNPRDDAMVFYTPLDGGATTPNTQYVRTELRELYRGVCDFEAANWSPRGKHVLRGSARVVQANSTTPVTIVGQIHAHESEKALLKLQYEGPRQTMVVIFNEDPVAGLPFRVDIPVVPGFDRFSYVVSLVDGKMDVAVTHAGRTAAINSVTFGVDISSEWFEHVYFFKAGSYAQSPIENGGTFEVHFYELDVEHST